ncbi:MFS transporter, partial [Campylobacter novaezeelandiae]|nr:MFS transporter [Campylobacter novaezeelandiae]
GFFACSSISALKILSIIKAKRHTFKTIDSSVSINEAAFNVGIALASFIGGIVLSYLGIEFNALFCALFVLPALILSLFLAKDKFSFDQIKRKK